MKAKKAIKRLRKAQLLLSSVVKQYTESRFPIRDLSDAANSIDRAKAFMEPNETSSSNRESNNQPSKGTGLD